MTAIQKDVQLIEGLWNIDMDLGVSKHHYDPELRAAFEKETELEIRKDRELRALQQSSDLLAEKNSSDLPVTVDVESGEFVPINAGLSEHSSTLDPFGLELQHVDALVQQIRRQDELNDTSRSAGQPTDPSGHPVQPTDPSGHPVQPTDPSGHPVPPRQVVHPMDPRGHLVSTRQIVQPTDPLGHPVTARQVVQPTAEIDGSQAARQVPLLQALPQPPSRSVDEAGEPLPVSVGQEFPTNEPPRQRFPTQQFQRQDSFAQGLSELSALLEISQSAAFSDSIPSSLDEAVNASQHSSPPADLNALYSNNSASQFLADPLYPDYQRNTSFRIPSSQPNSSSELFDSLGMMNISAPPQLFNNSYTESSSSMYNDRSPLYQNASMPQPMATDSMTNVTNLTADELMDELSQPGDLLDELLQDSSASMIPPARLADPALVDGGLSDAGLLPGTPGEGGANHTHEMFRLLPEEPLVPRSSPTGSDSGLGSPSANDWSPNPDDWSPDHDRSGLFDGLEAGLEGSGAAGGRTNGNQPHGRRSGPTRLGYSYQQVNGNYSDENMTAAGVTEETSHVTHNHTYPAQPGSIPRDLRSQATVERDKLPRSSRDEKRIQSLRIPFTLDEIVSTPVELFNKLMQQQTLNDLQLQTVRDIRRRGKNKVAAQNCRKRKIDVIVSLADRVDDMRRERNGLAQENRRLNKEHESLKNNFRRLYDQVFQSFRDSSGRRYDPGSYSLHLSSDNNVFVVPGNGSQPLLPDDSTQQRKPKRQ